MEGSGVHFGSVPGVRGPIGVQVCFSVVLLFTIVDL